MTDRPPLNATTATNANQPSNLPLQQSTMLSNQSANLQDIKKLTSEEVQLLKTMGQRISKTTTQDSFTALVKLINTPQRTIVILNQYG